MDHDMLDAGRPGSRRSVEDPRVAIGRAVARAAWESPLNAALREFPERILKGMESRLKPFRSLSRQFVEAAELIGAIDAFQQGEKAQLWQWVKERNGNDPDSILAACFSVDLPRVDDADAGPLVTLTRRLARYHRVRIERVGRAKNIKVRSRELRAHMSTSHDRDYMQALMGYQRTPKQMLDDVLPGAIFSVGENVPLEHLRSEAQRLIRDDNRLLWQTRKLGKNKYGDEQEKIISLDAPDLLDALEKELADELFLAAFIHMEDERRRYSSMRHAGLTPREWQIVELQMELYSRAEMANMLGTSVENVNTHASNAARKLRQVQNF